MKLVELGLSLPQQVASPQSPGSRGLRHNKQKPAKRYFDTKIKSKNTNRQN